MDLVNATDSSDRSMLAGEITQLLLDGPISDALSLRAASHTFVKPSETAVAKIHLLVASPLPAEFMSEYAAAPSGGGLCQSDICMSVQICHTDVCPPKVLEA